MAAVSCIGGAGALTMITKSPVEGLVAAARVRVERSSERTTGMRMGIELKVGRGVGWDGRRIEVGDVFVVARLFGVGGVPSLSRIIAPRRPGQYEGEESCSGDEAFFANMNVELSKNEQIVGKNSRVLQDQFYRFAAAVALADRKMAEEIIREMGDGESPNRRSVDFPEEENLDVMEETHACGPVLDDLLYEVPNTVTERNILQSSTGKLEDPSRTCELNQEVQDISDLERQLEELYDEVERMINDGEERTAREIVEANYEALLEQLDTGVHGVEQVAMLDILAQLYMNMGDYGNAEVLLEKINVLLKHTPIPPPFVNNIMEHAASMYAGIGRPQQAIPLYIESLETQRRTYGKNDPLTARTILGLAKAYNDSEEGSKSIELYKEAVALIEKSRGQQDESLVLPLTHLGNTLLEEERVDEAGIVLLRVVRVSQRAYGARDGRVGVAACALARAKTAQGQVDEAVSLYRQGLDIMKGCSRFSSGDPVVEVVRTDLAEILNVLGRDAEAQELWEEILRLKEKELGSNDILLVPHLLNAATSYGLSEKFDKCEPLLRRSLQVMSMHYGPRAPQVSIPLEMLATSLYYLGQGLEAESLAREALSIRESHYGELHPCTGEAYNCLAAIVHGLKKDNEAEELLRKVLKIQERELGPDCPEIILTLDLLATLLNEQGRTVELQSIIIRMEKLESILTNSTNSCESNA